MNSKPKRVAIIGFDCAEPHLIQKHIDEGHLPTFKKLFEGGVLAQNCLSPFPTITPPNWATIATGAWPGTHGVTDYYLHREGTDQNNANIFEAFSSENCRAEFIWDRLDAAGKKCIVCNYPGSWPSRMKNGIMVGGTGLSVNEYRNGHSGLDSHMALGNDQYITTGYYPMSTRVTFEDAAGWKNLPKESPDPLAVKFNVLFIDASEKLEPVSWYILLTQSSGNDYDRATLCTSDDFNDALFTLKPGEWSKKIYYKFRTQDGREIEASFKAKLLQLSDDAEDFLMYISLFGPSEGWSSPEEVARELKSEEGIMTFSAGLLGYTMGFYEMDTYGEIVELHDQWLGDISTQLMTRYPWDLYCMHIHPIDWIYHSILTAMDKNTNKNEETYKNAWELHLRVLKSQDRLLARLVEAAGEDTLFVLVSDHGAAADGTPFNPYVPLIKAGLCVMEGQGENNDTRAFEEQNEFVHVALNAFMGETGSERIASEILEMATYGIFKPDVARSMALPQRTMYIYVNLKGRDPGGIVEPADYEKVQQQIIDALYSYVDPTTGRRPVSLALSKQDARILGLHGDRIGDVVYAIYPQYGGQHGPHLPTAEWGIGKLKAMQVFYGPGFKKGYKLERTSGLTDIVPTICYLMNWPLPAQAEGNVLYQALENPNSVTDEIIKTREALQKMESALSKGAGH